MMNTFTKIQPRCTFLLLPFFIHRHLKLQSDLPVILLVYSGIQ